MASYNQLTNLTLRSLKEPGLHLDGRGLYVRVDQTGGRFWVLRFSLRGRRREMGLGSLVDVDLKEARQKADDARSLLRDGIDPIEARKAASTPPMARTFEAVASSLMNDLEKTWRSPKSRGQWEASLKQHAPAIWSADVSEIDTEMVLTALRPIWTAKHETASRIRGRIERVLDAAKVRGFRSGENPARWRGHLSVLLMRPNVEQEHHPAMPYEEVPAFVGRLLERRSVSASALRFLILTAARSGEVRGATWDEIEGDLWRIPGERMKGGREHRVPLTKEALVCLPTVRTQSGIIFPGLNGKLTDMALLMAMRKMKVTDATPHGFRSAFKDWASDCTAFPDEISEEALAHAVGSTVRRAYRRGEAMEKRRRLMEAWADHCTGKTGQLLPFGARA